MTAHVPTTDALSEIDPDTWGAADELLDFAGADDIVRDDAALGYLDDDDRRDYLLAASVGQFEGQE